MFIRRFWLSHHVRIPFTRTSKFIELCTQTHPWSVSDNRQIPPRWRGRSRKAITWRTTATEVLFLGRPLLPLNSIFQKSSSCSDCGCGRRGSSRAREAHLIGTDLLQRNTIHYFSFVLPIHTSFYVKDKGFTVWLYMI